MSAYKILYWKEIPTQLKYKDNDGNEGSFPLSLFFQTAIDAVAMHDGSIESGAYLDAWDWGPEIQTTLAPEEIIKQFDDNIPKSFINKIKSLPLRLQKLMGFLLKLMEMGYHIQS